MGVKFVRNMNSLQIQIKEGYLNAGGYVNNTEWRKVKYNSHAMFTHKKIRWMYLKNAYLPPGYLVTGN